jgi:hypothetical protein
MAFGKQKLMAEKWKPVLPIAFVLLVSTVGARELWYDKPFLNSRPTLTFAKHVKYNPNLETITIQSESPAFTFNGNTEVVTTTPKLMGEVFINTTNYDGETVSGNYRAKIYCFPGKGDNNLYNNPMVVPDAFDPGSSRGVNELYNAVQYKYLLNINDYGFSPRNSGYDVFFLDFVEGGGEIQKNAAITLKFIEWLQQRTTSEIIVGGPSMGGIVSRLALLYSMPQNNTMNTDLAKKVTAYLSIDSPQQGASIAPSMQQATQAVASQGGVNTLVYFGNMISSDEVENTAVEGWNQLSTPAAHQMIYQHYYCEIRDLNGKQTSPGIFSTTLHDRFYGLLTTLGSYKPGLKKIAIAYSNFYSPHPGLSRTGSVQSGTISPPGFSRTFYAGGTSGNPEKYELYPGSTGNWYYQTSKGKSVKYVNTNSYGSEVFKGTFIPINSALDLNSTFDVFAPTSTAEGTVKTFSPFDKVFYMKDEYNRYKELRGTGVSGTIDDMRYEHIVFDSQVMNAINNGLRWIKYGNSMTPIYSLLLQ